MTQKTRMIRVREPLLKLLQETAKEENIHITEAGVKITEWARNWREKRFFKGKKWDFRI